MSVNPNLSQGTQTRYLSPDTFSGYVEVQTCPHVVRLPNRSQTNAESAAGLATLREPA